MARPKIKFTKEVQELLTTEKPIKPVKAYDAYVYQNIHCGECFNKMFPDERDMTVQCMNSRCSYRGLKFKAPMVNLVRA